MLDQTRCGYIAIIGKPNVGKSTLLNQLLGQKLSITSRKPQTTKYQILGIKTKNEIQMVFVDTPGLHMTGKSRTLRRLNKIALSVLTDVDIILVVLDAKMQTEEDNWILNHVKKISRPAMLLLNKIDWVEDKKKLLPVIESLSEQHHFTNIIPISARTGKNLAELEAEIIKLLPKQPHFFPPEQLTDRKENFLASEMIREKLMRNLGQELPYEVEVEVNTFTKEDRLLRIEATIYVDKSGQKAIVIGEKGEKLKRIGTDARKDMERFFKEKVFLQLWVKAKEGKRGKETRD